MAFNLDKSLSSRLAKTLAAMCVRHTGIEAIHAGIEPVLKRGTILTSR